MQILKQTDLQKSIFSKFYDIFSKFWELFLACKFRAKNLHKCASVQYDHVQKISALTLHASKSYDFLKKLSKSMS